MRLVAAGWLGLAAGAVASAAEGPRLTWQMSPDRSSLTLDWHDPAGIRAVLESTTDFQTWHEVQRDFYTSLTNFSFRPPIYVGARPWWAGDRPVEVTQAFRVRRWAPPREGRVWFANRFTAFDINAPVTFLGDLRPGSPLGGEGLAGPQFLAQLVVNVPGVYLGTIGHPVPFRDGAFRGGVAPHEVIVPMDGQADEVHVTMVAWVAALAPTFIEALAMGIGNTGQSQTLIIRPATGVSAPAPLLGLAPFSIYPGPAGGP
ncbi:MAG: hypothetical protein ACKVYV_09520 [Limisphaerales bacterium]